MKNKNLLVYSSLAIAVLACASCDKYLDVLPDNRAEIDSETKVQSLLVSAYIDHDYATVTQYISDDVQNTGDDNPYTDRFIDQVYAWDDVTESNNSSPEAAWESLYKAIASANHALKAIEDLGGPTTDNLKAAKGEALLCRAYNHFMLTNLFCMHYDSKKPDQLGIPYANEAEHNLNPTYERGTVAQDYACIEADLEEGLPLINDAFYSVPKYHFNQKAAYAFATRFYLYYEKPDKAIECANKVLGTAPQTMLRDYKHLGGMTSNFSAVSQEYVSADANCNLLLSTSYCSLGLAFGPYYVWAKYTQTPYITNNETADAQQPWMGTGYGYYATTKRYAATNLTRCIFWRIPYLFEYTDAVAGVVLRRAVIPLFTTDECLLNRAEAYILKGDYDSALADMNLWVSNVSETGAKTLDVRTIKSFYDGVNYAYDGDNTLVGTVKKHLHPAFDIDEEGSTQESMLQAVLNMRRIETLQTGLRWFDVKRYGIEINRMTLNPSGMPGKITDELLVDDPRRAIQIPLKVRDAGMTPNPRNE